MGITDRADPNAGTTCLCEGYLFGPAVLLVSEVSENLVGMAAFARVDKRRRPMNEQAIENEKTEITVPELFDAARDAIENLLHGLEDQRGCEHEAVIVNVIRDDLAVAREQFNDHVL